MIFFYLHQLLAHLDVTSRPIFVAWFNRTLTHSIGLVFKDTHILKDQVLPLTTLMERVSEATSYIPVQTI